MNVRITTIDVTDFIHIICDFLTTCNYHLEVDRMKKLIPIIIAITMILSIFIIVDSDSDAEIYGSYVNGQEVSYGTEVNKENEHWRYDEHGLTITGDTVFEGTVRDGLTAYCIYKGGFGDTLNIILNADLLIKACDEDLDSTTLAIYTPGSISISGPGSLTIDHGDPERHIYQGLTAGDNVTINGSMVTICTNFDITASQLGWGTSFTMNNGELNLIGSGTIMADNIYIKGGTINVNGVTGSVRNNLSAYSDHGGSTFEMTDGVINFANVSRNNDNPILSAMGTASSNLNLHNATGKNWKITDDHFVDAIKDGPVTIESSKSFYSTNSENVDEKVVLGIPLGCIVVLALALIGSNFMAGKK